MSDGHICAYKHREVTVLLVTVLFYSRYAVAETVAFIQKCHTDKQDKKLPVQEGTDIPQPEKPILNFLRTWAFLI